MYWSDGTFWRIPADGAGARTKISGSGVGVDCCGHLSSSGRLIFNSIEARGFTPTSAGAEPPTLANREILIWTVKPDGSELTQYREGALPRWSHDEKRILFEFKEDLWMMDAAGSNLVQITNSEKTSEGLASFSPDDRRVVYASNEGARNKDSSDFNIWISDTDGTNRQQLTSLRSWDSWPVMTTDAVYFLSGRGAGKARAVRIWRISLL